jgi:superfamily II DNA/RNA helicase
VLSTFNFCRIGTYILSICLLYSVERLFLKQQIRIIVATATLAWGVNLPARLVIVKGTEFFDGKTSRYVDYPLTDILQMIGRAGRPGFDTQGRAVVMVESSKKNFYKVRAAIILCDKWESCSSLSLVPCKEISVFPLSRRVLPKGTLV